MAISYHFGVHYFSNRPNFNSMESQAPQDVIYFCPEISYVLKSFIKFLIPNLPLHIPEDNFRDLHLHINVQLLERD